MFCTSLRKRPKLADAVSILSQNEVPRYQERSLISHDIALTITMSNQPAQTYCFLLLSAGDVDTLETEARIDRQYHLNGGQQAGLLFLMQERKGDKQSMKEYLQLQANLVTNSTEMPILPLHSLSALPATLFEYTRALSARHSVPQAINPVRDILPFCSANPPVAEHTAHVLSDIVPDLKTLSYVASTPEGQAELGKWLGVDAKGAGQVADVIDFWRFEYLAS